MYKTCNFANEGGFGAEKDLRKNGRSRLCLRSKKLSNIKGLSQPFAVGFTTTPDDKGTERSSNHWHLFLRYIRFTTTPDDKGTESLEKVCILGKYRKVSLPLPMTRGLKARDCKAKGTVPPSVSLPLPMTRGLKERSARCNK